jgi:hypothetical protein
MMLCHVATVDDDIFQLLSDTQNEAECAAEYYRRRWDVTPEMLPDRQYL